MKIYSIEQKRNAYLFNYLDTITKINEEIIKEFFKAFILSLVTFSSMDDNSSLKYVNSSERSRLFCFSLHSPCHLVIDFTKVLTNVIHSWTLSLLGSPSHLHLEWSTKNHIVQSDLSWSLQKYFASMPHFLFSQRDLNKGVKYFLNLK